MLKGQGITHIVQAADNLKPMFPNDFKYMQVPVSEDPNTSQIGKYFKDVNTFIKIALKDRSQGNQVLIHCGSGNNVSPCFAAAYLIRYHKLTATKALSQVKRMRQFVRPCSTFVT